MTSILADEKKQIRAAALAARGALVGKDGLSVGICRAFANLPEHSRARIVLYYLDVRSEVRTRFFLPLALAQDKKIVVPYCVDRHLELFHLTSMEELEMGEFKILEPSAELRANPRKRVDVEEVDLIMVPGVAFDRAGARMGHGFGYYDRLLEHARADAPLVALAFECQFFPSIPVEPHDIFMDKIITEKCIYEGRGRELIP